MAPELREHEKALFTVLEELYSQIEMIGSGEKDESLIANLYIAMDSLRDEAGKVPSAGLITECAIECFTACESLILQIADYETVFPLISDIISWIVKNYKKILSEKGKTNPLKTKLEILKTLNINCKKSMAPPEIEEDYNEEDYNEEELIPNQENNSIIEDSFQEFNNENFEEENNQPQDDIFEVHRQISSKTGAYEEVTEEVKEFLPDFIAETSDIMHQVENELLEMEKTEDFGKGRINNLFRGFHTVKGNAGFMGLMRIVEIAHKAEEVLSSYREKNLIVESEFFNTVFSSMDVIQKFLGQLKDIAGKKELKPVNMKPALDLLSIISKKINSGALDISASIDESMFVEDLDEEKTKSHDSVDFVRVPASKLDNLAELIGEMVIAISLLRQDVEMTRPVSKEGFHDIERITETLRDRILGVRMFPLKSVFMKLERQVRDLGVKLNKKVRLTLQGEDTLVDKSVIDEIYSPLMHIIRNALDHGLEDEEQRKESGKDPVGHISLVAEHRGDTILIIVEDDGKGIDKDRIYKKAVDIGIFEQGIDLTDEEIYSAIFNAGFSTAEKVTDVSGRGVGMDVVNRTVQILKGTISIQSKIGLGTKFLISLPLTTSIIEGLVVKLGTGSFIFPILNIEQIVTPDQSELRGLTDNKGDYFLLNGKPVTIVKLNDLFGISNESDTNLIPTFVIVSHNHKKYGFLVDDIVHRQHVVVKDLGERFTNIEGISGGTILGNGQVGYIIDPIDLLEFYCR